MRNRGIVVRALGPAAMALAIGLGPLHAQPRLVRVVSAASFETAAAPGMLISIFGEDLATQQAISETRPLPVELAGASVTIIDGSEVARLSPLIFVSPGQINCIIPRDVALGPAEVRVRSDLGEAFGSLLIESVAPGLFAVNEDGYAAAVSIRRRSGSVDEPQSTTRFDQQLNRLVAAEIDLTAEEDEVFLTLFGTGFREIGAAAVSADIDGVPIQVLYAGPQGSFEGLDQVNLGPLPRVLSGRGEVEISTRFGEREANSVRVVIGGSLVAPRPRLTSTIAGAAVPGQDDVRFVLAGENLADVFTIRFSDNQGVQLFDFQATDTLVTVDFALRSDAAPGTRTLWVESPAGRSNSVEFTIEGLSPIPRIFNLGIYPKSIAGNFIVAWVEFDFTDDDGDIVFTGRADGSARLSIILSAEGRECNISTGTDPILDHAGNTSGYVHGMIYFPEAGPGEGETSVTLIDAAGNRSNTLTSSFPARCP